MNMQMRNATWGEVPQGGYIKELNTQQVWRVESRVSDPFSGTITFTLRDRAGARCTVHFHPSDAAVVLEPTFEEAIALVEARLGGTLVTA
jgi:hypothetical protein